VALLAVVVTLDFGHGDVAIVILDALIDHPLARLDDFALKWEALVAHAATQLRLIVGQVAGGKGLVVDFDNGRRCVLCGFLARSLGNLHSTRARVFVHQSLAHECQQSLCDAKPNPFFSNDCFTVALGANGFKMHI
jgi:hypothetical protein